MTHCDSGSGNEISSLSFPHTANLQGRQVGRADERTGFRGGASAIVELRTDL